MALKITPISCPNCGSPIKLEKKGSISFCPYCGYQIHIEDGSTTTININKTSNKYYHYRETNDADVIRAKNEGEHLKRKDTRKLYKMLELPILILFLFFLTVFFTRKDEQDKIILDYKYNQIVEEVQSDIANGDYVSARAAANEMYFPKNELSIDNFQQRKKWNDMRKYLLKLIEAAEADD